MAALSLIAILYRQPSNGWIESYEYHYTYDEDGENSNPIITLEVMLNSSNAEHSDNNDTERDPSCSESTKDYTCMDYLMDSPQEEVTKEESTEKEQECADSQQSKSDLLEYMIRNDGSVVCKLCGEVLQSRTHYYRHKYKLHVPQSLNPAPLFQCEQCLVFFKSRKGYIGHIHRHNETPADSNPAPPDTEAETTVDTPAEIPSPPEVKEDPDPELSIPKTTVPNYQTTVVKQTPTRSSEPKKPYRTRERTRKKAGWEERRSREEKLVADIIDRVRRECEAQGSGSAARKGYTRRTTVMHT